MIQELITGHLARHAAVVAIATAAILVSMVADLITGIQKARQRGEATTSKGLKKTAEKAEKYFMPYIVMVCVDAISSAIVPIPVFSMLWAAYCCLCEWKSVREKWWEKSEIERQNRTMRVIVENKDDIAKLVREILCEGGSSAPIGGTLPDKPKENSKP